MTDAPAFLTVEQVLAIHSRMMQEFGGESSVRDLGLLESAVMIPAAWFEHRYLHDGLPAMAAAYLFHLCRNHPFGDGNKRTALASAEIFLLLNGHLLSASDAALEGLTLGMAEGRISKDKSIQFFRRHAASETSPG